MVLNVARMTLGSFRMRLVAIFAIGLSVCVLPVRADDELIATAATKSEDDEKPAVNPAHPLYKLLLVAYKSKKNLESVDDYVCTFSKKEMLKSKLLETTMTLKIREKPFSVYLKFRDANEGREVIYVEGMHKNNLLVHEGGLKSFIGTLTLSPKGPDAMADNKYPVTSIGLRNMVDTVIKQWETEGKFGGIKVQQREAKLPTGEACIAYEAIHEPFKEFKFHTTRLYVDTQTGIAIGIQQFAFPGKNEEKTPIAEEYFYAQLKTNLKLTNRDFDPKNPDYKFEWK